MKSNNLNHLWCLMDNVMERTGISTSVGTPLEMQRGLEASHADRVLVVEFQSLQPSVVDTVAGSLSGVLTSMLDLLKRQDKESLERLAEVLVPRTPPSPRLLREAAMLARARNAVLSSGDWLTAAQVAEAAGLSSKNPSAQPHKWKKQGQIFAVNHRGIDYFPGYALDPETGFRPVVMLASIIDVFAERKDGWGMAYWFGSENSFLGGRRPQDLLISEPALVLEAAKDEVKITDHA